MPILFLFTVDENDSPAVFCWGLNLVYRDSIENTRECEKRAEVLFERHMQVAHRDAIYRCWRKLLAVRRSQET